MTSEDGSNGRWRLPAWARRFRVIAVLLGALVVCLSAMLATGFLGGFVSESSGFSDGRLITIDDEHVAVELTVPAGIGIDRISTNPDPDNLAHPGCPTLGYKFGADLVIEAIPADCAIRSPQQVMNGRHGTYRKLADVPDPIDPRAVTTTIGSAQVFEQHYSEHTNVSSDWQEPVAIVTLDSPIDPDFSTLVVRSDKAALSRDELTKVVASLRPVEE